MKWFCIEFSFGPPWHLSNRIFLGPKGDFTRTVRRLGKAVSKVQIRPYADEEDSPAILGHAVVFRIEHGPFDSVACESISADLVVEEITIWTEGHAVYIFDNKSLGMDNPQNAIKLSVKIIN